MSQFLPRRRRRDGVLEFVWYYVAVVVVVVVVVVGGGATRFPSLEIILGDTAATANELRLAIRVSR